MAPTRQGFDFYRESLKEAKFVLAPMVDASELAWRMLARRYGAHVCYTPMLHSAVFVRDAKYRKENLKTCPEDRPLIVQFCANDPETFRQAVQLTLESIECDAIDLNLGCPQVIARRGHFGSFLQDEWDLVHKLVAIIHQNFDIPITCKLRIFPDVSRTVAYCQMLEAAGAQLLTVHGRTREQKGPLTGIADWKQIEEVRKAVRIPVFANGNIQYLDDVFRCLEQTGVQGVMSAEGHLTNPALFAGLHPPVWQMALEYLELVHAYPCPVSFVRGHLFKLLHHLLQIKENADVRQVIAKATDCDEFLPAVQELQTRYAPFASQQHTFQMPDELKPLELKMPPWLCQPYVRPSPEEFTRKMQVAREAQARQADAEKRSADDQQVEFMSKKKLKKLERNPHKKFPHSRESCVLCASCPNPAGTKCSFRLCKQCCRLKCFAEQLDCHGHKILIRTKRQLAMVEEFH